MLPFLKKDSPPPGLEVKIREPDESDDQNDPEAAHQAAAQEILDAVHSKDAMRLADALKDMFNILDSEPHSEGPHIEPHSYDASKQGE